MPILNGKDYEDNDNENELALDPQDAADFFGANRLADDGQDHSIAFCIECKNVQPDQYAGKSPFFNQGGSIPCKYCNTPDAPIWMGDFSFKALGDIVVGDEIIGIKLGTKTDTSARKNKNEIFGWKSRLDRTYVTAVNWHAAPVVKVVMESGNIIYCTDNHYWYDYDKYVTDTKKNGLAPFTTAQVGKRLSHVVDTFPIEMIEDQSYWAGYLAGIYDGEGGGLRIGQSNIVNPNVCARISAAFNKLDISYTETTGHNGPGMVDYTITGGIEGYKDFLGKCNPAKRDLEKYILSSRFRTPDSIVAVEPAFNGSEVDVVDLTTETGNYVAWGYASKNCGGVTVITDDRIINDSFKDHLDRNRGLGSTRQVG